MKSILFAFVLLSGCAFAGRSYAVKFTVIDDVTETPLEGVLIACSEQQISSVETDENGTATYIDCKEEWLISTITAEGYHEQNVYTYSNKAKEDVAITVRMVPADRPNISVARLARMKKKRAAYQAVWDAEIQKRQDEMKDIDTNVVQPCSFGSDELEESDDDLYFDPEFPGGQRALQRYIAENVEYPEYAIDHQEQGKVYLSFDIEKDGTISNIEILKGTSPSIDAEAFRVIYGMPKWIPGYCNGRPLKVISYKLPIVFTLN